MAKTKKELQDELTAQGIEFTSKNTIAELKELLEANRPAEVPVTEEADITEAAMDAAEQEQAVIQEKRDEDTTATAKAGKRSSKALREAAEKEAKEERKATGETEEAAKPKQPVKPTRSRLERRGKKFRKAAEQVDKSKAYSLKEAIDLAITTNPAKFDASVELHINLNVDPRQADQNIRDNLVLPAGTGKSVRVAVFSDDKIAEADLSGLDTITKALDKGDINFDVLVATPANMAKLGKYARTLGPRGLMPNPKSGTVTNDLGKAVKEAKAGRVEYRVDSTGIIHLGVGKVSFTAAQLLDNVQAVLTNVRGNKPSSVKGTFVQSIYLTTSMGPSIRLDAASV